MTDPITIAFWAAIGAAIGDEPGAFVAVLIVMGAL